ncbi:hypothetical protein BDW22DRAFT_1343011 [Trametopsis cervina]|nr:hypothetical protein BDW22DRAFT_1343011 [Trametopsis cervina]
MIDTQHPQEHQLNTYNVAQLHFALDQDKSPAIDPLNFDVHVLHNPLEGTASPALLNTPQSSDAEIDYSSRRMSSSAASDTSSLSRHDKRTFDYSPSVSPVPNKARPDLDPSTVDGRSSDAYAASPRVQLPSIASSFQDHHRLNLDARRASLPSALAASASSSSSCDSPNSRQHLRLPHPSVQHRASQSASSLGEYQFPDADDGKRPRLEANTQIGLYPDYTSALSTGTTPSSSFFSNNSPLDSEDSWAQQQHQHQQQQGHIVRSSSTPGTLSPTLKYDDSLRHSSLGGPQSSLYGGVTRISGQQTSHLPSPSPSDRASRNNNNNTNGLVPSIKTENDWTFPAASDFTMSPPASTTTSNTSPPNSATANGNSPTRSPAAPSSSSSLVERPPRKRGKLPKPVTDFLKDWLHRHSDHPYPSEEEKKALCHATGLSMSQVSNWMINARRRILAPAHRAAQGPTTSSPYAAQQLHSHHPHAHPHARAVLDPGRRASMDSLALYHPMSLQTISDYGSPTGGAGNTTSPTTRQLVSMSRSMSSGHASAGSLSAVGHHSHHPQAHPQHQHHHQQQHHGQHPYGGAGLDGYGGHRGSLYGPGAGGGSGALHPSSHVGSNGNSTSTSSAGYLGLPMGYSGYAGSAGRMSPEGPAGRYTFPEHGHGGHGHGHSVSPGPGSGYNTPH